MLYKYNPLSELIRVQRELDRLFSESEPKLMLDEKNNSVTYRSPLTDMYETDKEIVANIEVPGVDKKDIEIKMHDNRLEIKVEKNEEKKEEKKGTYRYERSYKGFYRCLTLPENADTSKASAEYTNGVLNISVPKMKEQKETVKRLEIK
ncbi:Hsp20/alpha crystallin family protein [Candidatus Woesearchaeota archaeon]|nr:Hsp20/alpha crystallin family protein [Candidatus Woesearchaeota archaeon]